MMLTDYASLYLAEVGASVQYRSIAMRLARRIDMPVTEFTVPRINTVIATDLTVYAKNTVRTHRAILAAIYHHAKENGVVDDCTRRISRVKVPQQIPRAWTSDEMRRLYMTAGKIRGKFRRLARRSQVMQAAILVGYSTALRLRDLLGLRHDNIREGQVVLCVQKTRRVHAVSLTEEAQSALTELPRVGPLVFGHFLATTTFLYWFRRIVKEAGLDGSAKYLRRSSATYACLAGIDPTGHLGHATPELARKHYLDPAIMAAGRPAVPPLLPASSALEPASGPQTVWSGIAGTSFAVREKAGREPPPVQ